MFLLTFLYLFVTIGPMLMIRLQRTGRTNDPSFRVVLTDKRNSPKSQNFVEILGNYEVKKGVLAINKEQVLHWIKMGAKPSPTMHNLLISEKIISAQKINVLPRKSPIKPASAEAVGEAGKNLPAEAPAVAEKVIPEATPVETPREVPEN